MKYFVVIALILFAACKEDSSCPRTMDNIAGTYRYTSILVKNQNFTSNYYMPCQNDDSVIMRRDGSYQIKDMVSICTPVSTNFDGTWSVTGNKLFVDGLDYNIQFFDCSSIIFTRDNTPQAGSSITFSARKIQ